MESKQLGRTDTAVPAIGMGTWNLSPPDDYAPGHPDEERVVQALRLGIELGLRHIDSAEMYGNGASERLIGQAIRGLSRESLFLATKVEPSHYHYEGVLSAARGSCQRLGTDYIDLYQLHWPRPEMDVRETLRAMACLVAEGTIRYVGVSNFSVPELRQAQAALPQLPIVSNQVEYHLLDRRIEKELLPFAVRNQVTIIAYSPLDTGRLLGYRGPGRETLERIMEKYNRTLAQVALNWLIAKPDVVTIPKAVHPAHLRENAAAAGWRMDDEDYQALDEIANHR